MRNAALPRLYLASRSVHAGLLSRGPNARGFAAGNGMHTFLEVTVCKDGFLQTQDTCSSVQVCKYGLGGCTHVCMYVCTCALALVRRTATVKLTRENAQGSTSKVGTGRL